MQIQTMGTRWQAIARHRWEIASGVVLARSLTETASLAVVHHTGPELYGVLTAALSAGAAVANLVLLRSSHVNGASVAGRAATAAVVVVWAVVALGGIAGVAAHVIGPVAGHGPVDLRPRPVAAPLVFTLLGAAGATALVLGRRARARLATNAVKE
jgi:hypothetical protein